MIRLSTEMKGMKPIAMDIHGLYQASDGPRWAPICGLQNRENDDQPRNGQGYTGKSWFSTMGWFKILRCFASVAALMGECRKRNTKENQNMCLRWNEHKTDHQYGQKLMVSRFEE